MDEAHKRGGAKGPEAQAPDPIGLFYKAHFHGLSESGRGNRIEIMPR